MKHTKDWQTVLICTLALAAICATIPLLQGIDNSVRAVNAASTTATYTQPTAAPESGMAIPITAEPTTHAASEAATTLPPTESAPSEPSTEPPSTAAPIPQPRAGVTPDELRLLAAMADHECYRGDYDAMCAVIEVALNRAEDGRWFGAQDSVTDVILAPGQYAGASKYRYADSVSDTAMSAAYAVVYEGYSVVGREAIFHSASWEDPRNICGGLYLVAEVGGNAFYGKR